MKNDNRSLNDSKPFREGFKQCVMDYIGIA